MTVPPLLLPYRPPCLNEMFVSCLPQRKILIFLERSDYDTKLNVQCYLAAGSVVTMRTPFEDNAAVQRSSNTPVAPQPDSSASIPRSDELRSGAVRSKILSSTKFYDITRSFSEAAAGETRSLTSKIS